jgi:prophage regulatory protein
MENKVLRWPAVKTLTGLSRPTIWRMERKGRFPSRVQLGASSVGWREDEIWAWINSRPRVGKVEGAK